MAKKIVMSKKEFKQEHKKLVRILRSGSRKQQMREADSQEKELKR